MILQEGAPIRLNLPAVTHMINGLIRFDESPTKPVTISIGSTIWSEQKSMIPFQAICRGPTTLLVTGFSGGASCMIKADTLTEMNAAVLSKSMMLPPLA